MVPWSWLSMSEFYEIGVLCIKHSLGVVAVYHFPETFLISVKLFTLSSSLSQSDFSFKKGSEEDESEEEKEEVSFSKVVESVRLVPIGELPDFLMSNGRLFSRLEVPVYVLIIIFTRLFLKRWVLAQELMRVEERERSSCLALVGQTSTHELLHMTCHLI